MPAKRFNTHRIKGDVAELDLTNKHGQVVAVALVDAADLPRLIEHGYRWSAAWFKDVSQYRVVSRLRVNGKKKTLYLSRFLLEPPEGHEVDHISRDTLDNRRQNLRSVAPVVNNRNKSNSQQEQLRNVFVTWNARKERFVVRRYEGEVNGRKKFTHFGSFKTREEADRTAESCRLVDQKEGA